MPIASRVVLPQFASTPHRGRDAEASHEDLRTVHERIIALIEGLAKLFLAGSCFDRRRENPVAKSDMLLHEAHGPEGIMPSSDATISEKRKQDAEAQIQEKQREVDYDTKEYPVETLVEKYATGRESDENEIYVPDYQRDFAWDEERQSKFIESVIIGLPIPYVFVADAADKPDAEGRLEIVDGSQRIRTLAAFIQGELVLEGLEKLTQLNGFKYSDLPISRQRRFNRRTIRMIELTEKADEEVRRDIFERINTGSEELNDMEKRRGIQPGPFLEFVEQRAKDPLFEELVPLSKSAARRRERDEFVLRFFAYLDDYQAFSHSVAGFLNDFLEKKNAGGFDADRMKSEFDRTLQFVKRFFPVGFKKASTHARTSRIRFEALSVGTALALRGRPNLTPTSLSFLESSELKQFTTSDASNSRVKVVRRIEYVRDQLLASSP